MVEYELLSQLLRSNYVRNSEFNGQWLLFLSIKLSLGLHAYPFTGIEEKWFVGVNIGYFIKLLVWTCKFRGSEMF